MQDFIYNDFTKSGISEDVINEYINQGYLVDEEQSWKLYYPELNQDNVSTYFATRYQNPSNSAKYIRKEGEPSRIFRPLDLSPDTVNKSEYLIITEGEKKAIKAVQEGFPCLALGGVWGWKQQVDSEISDGTILDISKDILSVDIIPDIKNLDLKGKTVFLCYDNDMWSNEQVKNALYNFALYLICERQVIVKIINLPQEQDKLGLDDYLIKYGKEKFQNLLDNATKISAKEIQAEMSGETINKCVFPIDIFAEPLKQKLKNLAENLDSPIEYLASAFLSGASVIMNGRYSILVSQYQNWYEHPILWMAIIGNPSQKKSPSLKLIKHCIDKYDEKFKEEYETKLSEYKKEHNNYKIDMKRYEQNRLSKNPDLSITMPDEPEKPFKQRLTTQDVTVEALSKIAFYTERSIAIWVDELSSFFKGLGQYKKGGNDLEYFLQTWSKYLINIVRQDKDYTINTSHNIIGSIQPTVLDKTLFANGIDSTNGMLERWLYVCSAFEETGIFQKNAYDTSIIENIYQTLFDCNKVEQIYNFSDEAQMLFEKFCLAICKQKKQNGITDLQKNYMQKQTNYVARFALILHCIENPKDTTIQISSVKKAILLSEYFTKCFETITVERQCEIPLTKETINYMYAKSLATISPSKLYKSNTSKYKSVANAQIVLENLASQGRGRLQRCKNRGIKFILYK